MSRKDSSPKVTLFPFLAVLVCTMGALILLLVVTTRMIRKQALAELDKSVSKPTPAEVTPQPVVVEPQPVLQEPEPATVLHPVEIPHLQPPPVEEKKVDLAETSPPPPPFPDRLAWELQRDEILRQQAQADEKARAEWESKVSELRAHREMLLDQLKGQTQSITRVKTEGEKAREQVARYEKMIQDSTEEARSINEHLQQLASAADEVTSRMQLLEGEILQLEHAPPPKPEYQVVAFDALTGTTRRPILIECTADSVIFASEQVTITADQMTGFTPPYNPLLAGARALTAYWTQHDGPNAPRPYVLLVVRAEGTVGFYVARKMLEQLGEPFGYELVEDDKPIHWPEADPGAVEVCRKAVERVLSDQVHMQQRLAVRGGLGLSRDKQFSGSDGNFWLPEVDQLRDPDDQVTFGGRTYSKRASTGSAAYPPRQPLSPAPQNLSGQITDTTSPLSANPPTTGNAPKDGIPAVPPDPQNSTSLVATTVPDQTAPPSSANPANSTSSTPPPSASNPSTQGNSQTTNGLDPSFLDQLIAAAERARENQTTGEVKGQQVETGQASSTAGSLKQSLRGAVSEGEKLPDIPDSLMPFVSGASGSGMRGRSGTIGLERQIILDISPNKVVIDDQLGLDISSSTTTAQLQQLVAQGLDLQIRGWGASPGGFYWKPYLKVVVHPGGNANLARLTELFRHWKLQWTVDHRLD